MSNKIEQVNGIVKNTVGDKISYLFPGATIIVTPSTGNIRTYYIVAQKEPDSVIFDNLDEKYGTTTAEEFVDYLATNSFFFEPPPSGVLDVNIEQDSVGLGLESTLQQILATSQLIGLEATQQLVLSALGTVSQESTLVDVLNALNGFNLESTQVKVLEAVSGQSQSQGESLLSGESLNGYQVESLNLLRKIEENTSISTELLKIIAS